MGFAVRRDGTTAMVADGVPLRLETITDYPFKDTVRVEVAIDRPARFELLMRAPAWCESPEVRVNGEVLEVERSFGGFLRLERVWRQGDRIELALPMRIRALERPGGAIALTLGPLTLAFAPGEVWEYIPGAVGLGEYEIRFRCSWSYALALDPARAHECRVERLNVSSPPFSHRIGAAPIGVGQVPLRVYVPGGRARPT